ncbi:MAG: hypothetical protein HQK59_12420 [Deltaproteobacteria bacterium]|nr:hypothetical protein [Deltaproteobacteria bacterium]
MTTRPTYYKAICLVISLCLLGLGALQAQTCCCTRYLRSLGLGDTGGSGDTGGKMDSLPPCCRKAGKAAPISGIMADPKSGSSNWTCRCACQAGQQELFAEFTASESMELDRIILAQPGTDPAPSRITTNIPVVQNRTGGPPASPPLYLLGSALLC